MALIALGAAELRIQDRSGIYLTFYYAKSSRSVFVFHAFMKKRRTTPKHELDLAKKRLKKLFHEEA